MEHVTLLVAFVTGHISVVQKETNQTTDAVDKHLTSLAQMVGVAHRVEAGVRSREREGRGGRERGRRG